MTAPCQRLQARPFGARPVLIADLVKQDEKYVTLEERLILLIADNPDGWINQLDQEDQDKVYEWLDTGEAALFKDVFDRFYREVVEAMIAHFNATRQ